MAIVDTLGSLAFIALIVGVIIYYFKNLTDKERDAHLDSCMRRLEPVLTERRAPCSRNKL